MQAAGYMAYGIYLNKAERNAFAQVIASEMSHFFQDAAEVKEDSESYEMYLQDYFPKLGVYVLDGYDPTFQDQDPNAVLAVYMKERLNYVGAQEVKFDAPSDEAKDEIYDFIKKIGSGKSIRFIHWTAIEDN